MSLRSVSSTSFYALPVALIQIRNVEFNLEDLELELQIKTDISEFQRRPTSLRLDITTHPKKYLVAILRILVLEGIKFC